MWSQSADHKRDAKWLQDLWSELNVKKLEIIDINTGSLKKILSRMTNQKSTGPDLVQGFWLKNFSSLLEMVRLQLKECLDKACVHYFLSIFYFSSNNSLSKTMKNVFLFHLKSSFCSRDIPIFVFSSSPLFFPVSRCFRG